MSKDSSLQLLLIVDYIFDWARDIYRPYILRQLKSLTTGLTFDQISLTDDSDIMSMRRNISNWIQAAPSTIVGPDFEQDLGPPDIAPRLDHQSLLGISIPNTKLGTLRSASLAESRIEGLFITEQNVTKFLQLAGVEDSARQLVNFLAKWNELLLLTGDDLDELEEIWIGRSSFATGPSAPTNSSQFYVLMEVKTFISISWTIVRQLTYLAISKQAFEIIFTHANFKMKHRAPQLIADSGRYCSKTVLIDTFRCLISGSPGQVFATATSCVLFSLYGLPERKRSDYAPPIEALGFGNIRRSRLDEFIQKFHKIGERKVKKKLNIPPYWDMFPAKRRRIWLEKRQHLDLVPAPEDLSFIRNSEVMIRVSERDLHDESQCARCNIGRKYDMAPYHITASGPNVFSAYGLEIVISLDLTGDNLDRNDICLFAVADIPELADDKELAVIVEDLLQSRYGYHTIRHPSQPLNHSFILPRDMLWNLPLRYRPLTGKERTDLKDWVNELKGLPISAPTQKRETEFRWDGLQMLLHYFGNGKTWNEAAKEIRLIDRDGRAGRASNYCRIALQEQSEKDDKRRRKEAGEIEETRYLIGRWGPLLEYTRGD
jgi:hypothetical protein